MHPVYPTTDASRVIPAGANEPISQWPAQAPTGRSSASQAPANSARWAEIPPWPVDATDTARREVANAATPGSAEPVTAGLPKLPDSLQAEADETLQPVAMDPPYRTEPELLPLADEELQVLEDYQRRRLQTHLTSETTAADADAADTADASLGYMNKAQEALLDFTAPTACYTCNGAMGGCSTCGCSGCYPGQEPCCPCTSETRFGRFFCGIYQALCCPDPCYEGEWTPVADAAFFVDAARPQSGHRMRWDAGRNMVFPDRAEYFWARADGSGGGPAPLNGLKGVSRLDYDQISMYTEVAHKGFGFFVETPYRDNNPEGAAHGAGFTDMNLGTKSMLLDCELMQVTLQFRTFLPTVAPRTVWEHGTSRSSQACS